MGPPFVTAEVSPGRMSRWWCWPRFNGAAVRDGGSLTQRGPRAPGHEASMGPPFVTAEVPIRDDLVSGVDGASMGPPFVTAEVSALAPPSERRPGSFNGAAVRDGGSRA